MKACRNRQHHLIFHKNKLPYVSFCMEHTLLHGSCASICGCGSSIFFHIFYRTENFVSPNCILQFFVIFRIDSLLQCLRNRMVCIFHYGRHRCNCVGNKLRVFCRRSIHKNEVKGLDLILGLGVFRNSSNIWVGVSCINNCIAGISS